MEPSEGACNPAWQLFQFNPKKIPPPILLIQPRASGTTSLNCTNLTFSSLYYTV